MQLAMLLKQQNISTYQCSKLSGIPYTTLLELVRGKTSIEKCAAETIYRLASALNTTMDELYQTLRSAEVRSAFETFKSNVCHLVKEKGDIDFIIDTLQSDDIYGSWDKVDDYSRSLLEKALAAPDLKTLFETQMAEEQQAKESILEIDRKYPDLVNNNSAFVEQPTEDAM